MLGACALFLASCATNPPPAPAIPEGEIRQLNVMSVPVALNVDNIPGPDGFSVKVFANDARHPKPVRIREGQLEILIFNGTFFGLTNVPTPLRVWSFSARELAAQEFTAKIGVGYEFLLLWGTNRPTERLITVAARYTSPGQNIVTSEPSSVTVLDR